MPTRFRDKNAIGVRIGASPTLQLELNAYKHFKAFKDENHLSLVASVRSPFFLLQEFDSYHFSVGGSYQVHIKNHWKINWVASGFIGRVNNANGKFTNVGTDFALLPSYQTERLYIALWLGWQFRPATFLRHSDYIKKTFQDLPNY